ncbi:UHRF1-binding protein 1-like [Elysia marginata]|uniref:UHRF1-binding protein 1-like n=1 Tax=Elysia marginata TaxID=1093978 RepID=A0AAV4HTH8_9GAST|nr:UHRF1-binding protein 1-like [Elysia marginata]
MDFGEQKPAEHVDIKLEMLMPRVIVPAEEKVENQPDRPEAVQLQVSKLVVTNGRTEDGMTRADLLSTLDQYVRAGLFSSSEFPNREGQHSVKEEIIPPVLYQHADGSDDPYADGAIKTLLRHVESDNAAANQLSPPSEPVDLPAHSLNCNSLKRLASQDVWSVQAEQLWLEFLGAPTNKNRPVPFVEALPLTFWLSLDQNHTGKSQNEGKVNGIKGKDHENTSYNQFTGGSEGSGQENGRNNLQPVTFRVGGESPAEHRRADDRDQYTIQQHQSHHLMSSSPMMPVLGTSPPFSGSPVREDRTGSDITRDESAGHSHRTYSRDRVSARESRGNGKPQYNSLDRRQQEIENNGPYSEERERSSKTGHGATNGSNHSRKDQFGHYRYEDDDPREGRTGQSEREYSSQGNQRTRSQQRPARRDGSAQGNVEGRQRFQQHLEDGDPSHVRGRESTTREHAHSTSREHHRSRRDETSSSLQRQDSRSSSSPPRQSDGTRERRGRERKLRHSSSSSSEKRDPDTSSTWTVGSRGRSSSGLESRSNAEGQVSSYSAHGVDELQMKNEKRASLEDHFPSSDKRYFQGRDLDLSSIQKQEAHRGSSRGRHGSDSPDWSSPGGQARQRDRHLQRSSSRDSRGSRENPKEIPRRSPRTDSAKRSMSRDSPAGRRLIREPSRDSSDGRYESSDQQIKPVNKSRKNVGHQGRTSAPHSGEEDNDTGGGSSWGEDDGNGGRRAGRRSGGAARQHRSQSRGSERGEPGSSSGHRYPFPGRGENPVDISRPRCMTEEVDDGETRRGPNHRNSGSHCDKDTYDQGRDLLSNTDARMDGIRDAHGGSLGQPLRERNDAVESQQAPWHSQARLERENKEGDFRGGWGGHQEVTSSCWSQRHQRPPPDGCKSSQSQEDEEEEDARWPATQLGKNSTCTVNYDQKICALVKVGSKLRIQLNHFQFVFLLRLAESFAAFQNDLSADLLSLASTSSSPPPPSSVQPVTINSSRTCTTTTTSSSLPANPAVKSSLAQEPSSLTIIPVVLKELEFAVVCPYQMHQRTFSDDFSILSPFLQGVSSGQDAVFGEDGDTGSTSCFPQFVDSISKASKYKERETSLKPFQHSISFKSQSANFLESTPKLAPPPEGHQLARSFMNPAPHTGSAQQTSVNMPVPVMNAGVNPSPFSFENLRKEPGDPMSQSLNSKDSGIGIDRKSNSRGGQGRGASRGATNSSKGSTSDMKKAFTSAFSSFTDKLKNKMDGTESDDLETMSIRTDTSDDDFEHLSLDDFGEEVPAFLPHDPPPTDTGSVNDNYSDLGDPGDSVSMYAESSTTKGKEMVYVVLFKLDHTEICLESCENKTQARVQLAKLNTVQLGNISYDDFQTRFSSPKGYLQEDVSDSTPAKYPVRLRLDSITPDRGSTAAPEASDHLTILAEDLSLQFKMSGLDCLSSFAEDEKISADTIPMSLDVRNLLLVLEEDRPSANVNSPGSLPTNLHIQQISVERGKDGIFYIAGYSGNSIDPKRPASHMRNPPSSTSTASAASSKKPVMVNAVTSPVTSPDGTMALLMASQNEAVLLRRQLEEVRRANRLYEHQLLQWRDTMAAPGGRNPFTGRVSTGAGGGAGGAGSGGGSIKKRSSFTVDSLSSSPASLSGSQQDCSITGGGSSTVVAAVRPGLGEEIDPARDELERENLQLQQRMAQLEEDLLTVSKEKESLLQTLQLLQDELLASERRQRAKGKT